MKTTTLYDFTLTAGGAQIILADANMYKVLTATGDISVTRDGGATIKPLRAGRGERNVAFQRLMIKDLSGAPNSGTILVGDSDFIDDTIVLSSAINVRPEVASGFYSVYGAITLNTPETIFSAAANTKGAILLTAQIGDSNAVGDSKITILAKGTAPTNINDGEVMVRAMQSAQGASMSCYYGQLQGPQYIAAGKGLFAISNQTVTLADRTARYKLL